TRRTGLAALADRAFTLEPAAHVEPFVQLAPNDLLDGTADDLVAASTAETLVDGDAIGALDAVDQIGMGAEVAEGTVQVQPGATAGLAALDPAVAKLVGELQVTKEEMRIPADVTDDE